mgnify:CR=1 FL=1
MVGIAFGISEPPKPINKESSINKKIIKGSVSDPQIHWHQYVKVFRSLGEEKRFGTGQNFLQSKNLLDTLEINF